MKKRNLSSVLILSLIMLFSGSSKAYAEEKLMIESTNTYNYIISEDFNNLKSIELTEPTGWCESQYKISIESLPDELLYPIPMYKELELTDLKVNLELYDQQGQHHIIFENMSPLHEPDVFIVDTSEYDNSKAGTYKITISCTDKYQSFLPTDPVSFEVVVMEDPTMPTESLGWYESQYEISIKNLPDKIAYEIGDELDLTRLKVNLEFYDQHGGHHNICSYVSPQDGPDVFIVDTSEFDSSKAGTYKITISCTDKYQSFLPTDPVSFEVVVMEDPTMPTESPGWYESQYEISIKNLPDKIAYEIGDELDLTGLKVNLEFYDQHGGHHNICSYVSPQDGPDVFIVDTSEFDSSKAGTYKIKISCTDKYQGFCLTAPVSFDVTVNDSSPATTATSTSSTENTTTTTVTTTITVETNTEQTTEPPTTDAGDSVTTENSTVPPATTTGSEPTLPQTGYSKWYQALIAAAMGMIGVGSTAIVKSGIFRKKENNS